MYDALAYWQRIKEDVLYNQRAEYGKKILATLSKELTFRFGKGWSIYKLQHFVRTAYTNVMDTSAVIDGYKRSIETEILYGNDQNRALEYPNPG